MSARHRPPPPSWFVALVALALWYVQRAMLPADVPDPPPLQYAFFGWLIPLAGAIYQGLKAVGELGLFLLYQMIQGLWKAFGNIYNAAIDIGKGVLRGFGVAWGFIKKLYTDLLLPGWTKFWQWIDRARHWLEDFFRPIFEFLRRIREEILKFYDKWVRPILDTIEIARKALSVFKALGFEWAKKLDALLVQVEEKINAPFLFALQKLNEVINIIDRIVTADGLFQRLALIRSLERDVRYVSRAFINWRAAAVADDSYARIKQRASQRTFRDITRDTEEALQTGGGRYGPIVSEAVAQWRLYLDGRAP